MKKIRFIDSCYKELFIINNGDYIEIEFPDGEKQVRQVFYIDDYHIRTKCEGYRDSIYHICEFAEKMERMNATYKPV